MKTYVERRLNYDVNIYEIEIDSEMKKSALNFAKEIILSDNQYLRLTIDEVRNTNNLELQRKLEIQRTYVGKLGELVFSKFLTEMNINHSTVGMLDIFPGKTNVDDFDFLTKDSKTIDIKTGFRDIHKRLLINIEQFENIPKDYYVAIKLNAKDENKQNKLVDWDTITSGIICGYADYNYLKQRLDVQDFGEGPAKSILYNRLLGIDKLINKMK